MYSILDIIYNLNKLILLNENRGMRIKEGMKIYTVRKISI